MARTVKALVPPGAQSQTAQTSAGVLVRVEPSRQTEDGTETT